MVWFSLSHSRSLAAASRASDQVGLLALLVVFLRQELRQEAGHEGLLVDLGLHARVPLLALGALDLVRAAAGGLRRRRVRERPRRALELDLQTRDSARPSLHWLEAL